MTTARRRLPTLPLIRVPDLHLGYADINGLDDWHQLEHQYESAQILPRHPVVKPGLGPDRNNAHPGDAWLFADTIFFLGLSSFLSSKLASSYPIKVAPKQV